MRARTSRLNEFCLVMWCSSRLAAASRLTLAAPRRKGKHRPATRGHWPPLPPLARRRERRNRGLGAGRRLWAKVSHNGAEPRDLLRRAPEASESFARGGERARVEGGRGALARGAPDRIADVLWLTGRGDQGWTDRGGAGRRVAALRRRRTG